jgi:hypothetical protein
MVEEMVILLFELSDIDIIVLWFRIVSLLYLEVLKILVLEIIVHREKLLAWVVDLTGGNFQSLICA